MVKTRTVSDRLRPPPIESRKSYQSCKNYHAPPLIESRRHLSICACRYVMCTCLCVRLSCVRVCVVCMLGALQGAQKSSPGDWCTCWAPYKAPGSVALLNSVLRGIVYTSRFCVNVSFCILIFTRIPVGSLLAEVLTCVKVSKSCGMLYGRSISLVTGVAIAMSTANILCNM